MFLTTFQTLAVFVTSVTSGVPNEMDFFSETVNFLQDVCYSHVSCMTGTSSDERDISGCCGFCTCDDRCDERGSCCLRVYSSFEQSRFSLARTRYECVRPQYLSGTNTKYSNNFGLWMVTKCALRTTNSTLRELCEGDEQSLESITPVTYLSTDTNYRNEFCAFCNGLVENSALISWKLEIVCDRILFVSNKNFLATVREKRCNIFYKVPELVPVRSCSLHEYEISTCNVTGLWPHYSYSTELACNSVVDPFNKTYKNYYCYECNTETPLPPDQWACRHTRQIEATQHEPEFSAIIDVSAVVPVLGDEKLHCDTKRHFEDHKMMKCRDLLCHESRRLSTDGRCHPISNFESDVPCYVTFIKVTPLPGYKLNSFILERSNLLDNIKNEIQLLFNNHVTQFRIYAMTSRIDEEIIDFLVVYTAFSASSLKIVANNIAILFDVPTIEVNGFSGPESSLPFDLEMRSYETTFDESGPILHVKDENGISSTLNAIYVHGICNDTRMCSVFNKLFKCASIEIGFDELRMKIENSVLYIEENFAIGMKLLKWEYEIRGNKVRICLEDYRPIYDAMPVRPVIRQTSAAFKPRLSPFYALVTVFFSVYLKDQRLKKLIT